MHVYTNVHVKMSVAPYLLGYMLFYNCVFLTDKDLHIYSYFLSLSPNHCLIAHFLLPFQKVNKVVCIFEIKIEGT